MGKQIYFLFLGSFIGINAQIGSNPDPINSSIDMYPKTPEAAALSKFVDIPAGNYTGVADFTIPLYTIEFDGEKIPVELRYTTTGVTVGQLATRVGLGWVLNTGASLSQQVIGVQDKVFPRLVLKSSSISPTPTLNYPGSDYDIAMHTSGLNTEYGLLDIKPDIFSYSILDKRGKFIINAIGDKGIPMPYNQISIIRDTRYGQIDITDEQGFKYTFYNNDSVLKTKNRCTEYNVNAEFDYFDPNYAVDRVVSPKNKEVKYIYSSDPGFIIKYMNSVMTQARISLSKPQPPPPGPQPYHSFLLKCANYTTSADKPLKEIQFDGGKVLFTYNNPTTNPRQDINGDVFLTGVVVKNDKGEIIKNFSLNYDYFYSAEEIPNANSFYMLPFQQSYMEGLNRRLKLTSVKDNLTNGSYAFEYYESYGGKTLPYRISNNQDYWGIYNGSNNDAQGKAISLSRYENVNINGPDAVGVGAIGANKNPDINYGKLGNLKKITYPTGGYTEIEYEADDFDISDNPIIVYDYSYEGFDYSVNDNVYPAVKTQIIIPNNAENKTLNFTGRPNLGNVNIEGPCFWTLQKPNGTNEQGKATGSFTRTDPAGTYYLSVERDEQYPNVKCHATYSFGATVATPVETLYSMKSGTIRVSKIESFDNNAGKITRKYTYKKPTPNHTLPYTETSGVNQGEEMFMSLSIQKYPVGEQGGTATEIIASNNPGWQTATVRGKAVGYSNVQEYYIDHKDPANSYRKEYKFRNEKEPHYYDPNTTVNVTWINSGLDRGLLLEELLFDAQGKLIKKTENEYEDDSHFNNKYDPTSPYGDKFMGYGLEIVPLTKFGSSGVGFTYSFDIATFNLNNYWIKEKKSITTDYSYTNNVQDSLKVEKTIYYSPTYKHTFPKEIVTEGSKGEILKTIHKYPHDYISGEPDYSMMGNLIARNLIGTPVVTKSMTDNIATSEVRTIFGLVDPEPGKTAMVLPKSIYVKKGADAAEIDRKITYKSYDNKGNLTQYNLENGIPVSIIWGYSNTLPIAKIEGAEYDNIKANSLVVAVVAAAENDNVGVQGQTPEQTEQALNNALDELRKGTAFKEFLITTYTFDPLIGVKSVTPPSGIREYYFYDDAGRLQSVKIKEKDSSGNEVFRILKEYEYHYKH
ncbi:hypothetical protein [Chryseobacterium koreense]